LPYFSLYAGGDEGDDAAVGDDDDTDDDISRLLTAGKFRAPMALAYEKVSVQPTSFGAALLQVAEMHDDVDEGQRQLRKKKKKDIPTGPKTNNCPCEPTIGGWQAYLYFFSYTTASALILLSIVLGVIQSGMDEAECAKEERDTRDRRLKNLARKYRKYPKAGDLIVVAIQAFDNLDNFNRGFLTIAQVANAVGGNMKKREETRNFFEELDKTDLDEDDGEDTGDGDGPIESDGRITLIEFCNYVLEELDKQDVQDGGAIVAHSYDYGYSPSANSAADNGRGISPSQPLVVAMSGRNLTPSEAGSFI